MSRAVICAPLRTPIGRYGGVFSSLPAADLGAAVLRALLDRTGLDPALVEDVIVGNGNGSPEGPALGRVIAMDSGLPVTVPGSHVDRRCGSGLQAIINATMAVETGAQQLVVAGGAESMSNAFFYSQDMRWGGSRAGVQVHDQLVRARETAGGKDHPLPGGMIETAENLRRVYAISREAQDALAVESHRRAVAAQTSGAFADEMVTVTVPGRKGDTLVDTDEHPRAETSIEELAGLRPILGARDPTPPSPPAMRAGRTTVRPCAS